ncbi:MAG: Ig-like domain-containing protein [Solirubrobacteraceae bacterium]
MSDECLSGSTSFGAAETRGRRLLRHLIWIVLFATAVAWWALPATAQAAGTTLSFALSPTSIPADGITQVTGTAKVTDANNAAAGVAEETVAFTSTGTAVALSAASCTTGSDGMCSITITGTTVGSATITATDATLPADQQRSQTLTLTAGPAATITLALNPSSLLADGVSTTTATATVADAQGHLLSGEPVVFTSSDAAQTQKIVNTTTTGSTSYTATITSTTTVGAVTITATDGSQTASQPLSQTAGPASVLTVTLNPAVIAANGTDTTTATATITDAQGHLLPQETAVAFSSSDKGQFFGQLSNNGNGAYSVQIRGSATPGRATITATDGMASGQAILDQTAGPSSTSLVASPATLVTNQTVSLFAAVSATGSPSGTITFENGGAPIARCIAEPIGPSNPSATCQTSFAASTSPAHVTAVFTPNTASTVSGSSGGVVLPVARDATSVALTIPATVTSGHDATFSATVSPPSDRRGPVVPSGAVQFLDNGGAIPFCAAQPLSNGRATCMITYRSAGVHRITTRYAGDPNFTSATSSTEAITVVAPRPQILRKVSAMIQWSFYYTPTYTRVLVLLVKGASTKAVVTVNCHGRGCPYAARTLKVPPTKHCGANGRSTCTTGTIDVARTFKNHHLSVGTRITVVVSRPQWIAKYFGFTIRAGRGPRTQISCLAPDHTQPGVGCSS